MSAHPLYQRLFAALLARGSRRIEPHLADRKRRLLGDLRGDVLEVGPGTGINFPYFGPEVRWVGVEPNRQMVPYLRRAAAARGLPIEVREGTAERLPAADGSADAVVATHVLCSVDDVAAALQEVRRVLRPGGQFVFLEHVGAPPGTGLRRVQRLVKPVWRRLAAGCQPDRDTLAAIERAGFAGVEAESFRVPTLSVAGPHVAGRAHAPSHSP